MGEAMKVIAEYLDLKVMQYEDGKFKAYDALEYNRIESVNWQDIRRWVINLLDNIELKWLVPDNSKDKIYSIQLQKDVDLNRLSRQVKEGKFE